MLLLTMRETFEPSANGDLRLGERNVRIQTRAFATRLPLHTALECICTFEEAFQAKYSTTDVIEFELQNVVQIEDLDDRHIELARVTLVERLHETIDWAAVGWKNQCSSTTISKYPSRNEVTISPFRSP